MTEQQKRTNYDLIKLPDPNSLIGKHIGKSALVIGTGNSTKNLLPFKGRLHEKFDVVIGLNFSSLDFENDLDYHLIMEKNAAQTYNHMKKHLATYNKKTPRICNFKGIQYYPKELNLYKATRSDFGGNPNIRKHEYGGYFGLLNGPINNEGLGLGSVAVQAIHLAGIMGCNKIYMIGVDLLFGDKDHYYETKDRYYRDHLKEVHKSKLIKTTHNNIERETTRFFKDSAEYIDLVVDKYCKNAGIEVFNLSNDSLLSAPKVLGLKEVFDVL